MIRSLLGFDFGGTKVDVGVGTFSGEIIRQRRLWVRNYASAGELVDESLRVGVELATDVRIAAVGVSTMGITHEDRVELAPNVPGWSQLALPPLFRKAFPGLLIHIDNDVRAALYAELLWGSLRGAEHGAYLNLGTGIAMAFVLHGHVFTGAHRAAGEIAYLWRRGERGFAAGRAPFEEEFGGGGLDRAVRERFGFTRLSDAFAHLDDAAVSDFVKATFQEVARGVGHILLALDVETVSVGGGIARRFDHIAPILEREWREYLPFPPRLVQSHFVDETGLHGALAVAAQGDLK